MKQQLILVILWLLPPVALAEVPIWSDSELEAITAKGTATDFIDFENDSLLLTQKDGFYTSGMRYSRYYRLRTNQGWRSTGWRFGQQLYTASDVRLEPDKISRFDHPYAGWLYGGFMMRSEADDGSETALGLDIGCLGPCAGGAPTQEFIHRVLKQPRPRGWHTQLGNEWGVVMHAGGRAPYWKLARWLDVRPGLSMRLGNIFTDLSAEASLRAGQLQSMAASGLSYVFLRGAVRAVAYDATLQGGLFSDDDARTVAPKRWTGEFEAGMQWQAPQWGLRVSFVRRSNEIAGLSASAGRQDMLRLSISFRH